MNLFFVCSPAYSRPTSPQSDSAVMCANQDATAQTHLTGDRLLLLDDVKWKWGEIPETTPHMPSIRRMSSKMSHTPVAVAGSVADHLPDTGVATMSPECGSAVGPAVEQTSEHGTADTLELFDNDSQKGLAATNNIQSSAAQPAGSNNIIDGQVIEPLPETKKGWFHLFIF